MRGPNAAPRSTVVGETGVESERRVLLSRLATGSIAYLLILLPAALGFLYVHLYGVNVPYNDGWTLVGLFEKLSSGTLTVADLFSQHNEHRIFFPRIVMLFVGVITGFNVVATMYLIQTLLLVTLVVLLLAFRSSVSPNPLWFVPIAFLVFSWGQSWNMLQAFQIQLVLVQTFAILAFWLLHVCTRNGRLGRVAFAGALGSATVAAFSSAHGLVVWPVGFMQLLFLPMRPAKRSLLIVVWSLVGLLEGIVYFLGYEHTGKTTVAHALDHPLRSLKFFLAALGGSLFKQPDLAFSSGILLTFLAAMGAVLVYKDGRWGECSFWIATLSFSLLILAGTTVARGMFMGNISNPKYVTYSLLVPIAVYALLLSSLRIRPEPDTVVVFGVLAALIVSSVPLSYAWGIAEAKEIQAKKEKTAFVLATYRSQPDRVLSSKGIFKERFPTNPEADRERAAVLERLGYSVFSKRWPPVLPPPYIRSLPLAPTVHPRGRCSRRMSPR
jgi:hypothetical protein